jgi:hypothetical protein
MIRFYKSLLVRLTRNILLGPKYLESLMDRWISSEIQQVETAERKLYSTYLTLIAAEQEKAGSRQRVALGFLAGYFSHIQAKESTDPDEQASLLHQAAGHYEKYLAEGKNKALLYVAQWQIAEIGQELGAAWPVTESLYLRALEHDPIRGEAVMGILRHYYQAHEWRIAYIYSRHAVNHYLQQEPTATRHWLVDPSAYSWPILDYHIVICVTLRKKEEARAAYLAIRQEMEHDPLDFSGEDRERIIQYNDLIEATKSGKKEINTLI